MQRIARSFVLCVFVCLLALSVSAQTAATARIVVQDIPAENSILIIGPPGNPQIFQFAHLNPNGTNHWIDLNPSGKTTVELSLEQIAERIANALNDVAVAKVIAEWGGGAQVNLIVTSASAETNGWVLYTDADALCIGGFCGGSD